MEQSRRPLSKSGKTGIGGRLRQSLNTIAVDVWGLEKQTALSLAQYFEKVAAQPNAEREQFSIRINCREFVVIRMCVSRENNFQVDASEMFRLLNIPIIHPSDLEKLINKIKRFFAYYGEIYKSDDLQLSFKPTGERVLVHLMNNEDVLAPVPFQELLKKFLKW